MWVQRTSEEVARWQKDAESEACSHGRMVGGLVWVGVAILGAGGWFIFMSSGGGMAVQRPVSGDFWLRLPLFGLISAPFAYWVFCKEKQKELLKITRRTICPQCDTGAENNAGVTCKCGGAFVAASSVRWVE